MALPTASVLLGTVRFLGWEGWVIGSQDQGEEYMRLGATNNGAQITGTLADPSDCTAWSAFSSISEALTFVDSVEALQWQTVSMTDQWGATYYVRVTKAKAQPSAKGGAANYLVTCQLTVRFIESP